MTLSKLRVYPIHFFSKVALSQDGLKRKMVHDNNLGNRPKPRRRKENVILLSSLLKDLPILYIHSMKSYSAEMRRLSIFLWSLQTVSRKVNILQAQKTFLQFSNENVATSGKHSATPSTRTSKSFMSQEDAPFDDAKLYSKISLSNLT